MAQPTLNDLKYKVFQGDEYGYFLDYVTNGGGEPAGGATIEQVQDNLGTSFVVATAPLAKVYDDAGNTLTFSIDDSGYAPSAHDHDGAYAPVAHNHDGAYAPAVHSHTKTEYIQVACSDLTTAITAGTTKAYFRMPFAGTLVDAQASLKSACATGTFTVDVHKNAATVLGTKLTFDATERTTRTAAAARTLADTSFALDDLVEVDVDNAGDGTATGLILTLEFTK